MTKAHLNEAVTKAKGEAKEAMQIMYDALNQGQQKKIIKNEAVKKLFDLYEIEYSE